MRLSIRWKMLLSIALPIVAVYVAMIIGVITYLQHATRQGVQSRMTETAQRYAGALDAALRELSQIARSNAILMGTVESPSREKLMVHLLGVVDDNPLCYGAAIAFEPFGFEPGTRLFAPYVHRDGEGLRAIDIAMEAYDYTDSEWQWYDAPRRTEEAGWTAPYFDEGAGGILMSTFSVPFFRDGRFAGVATVDIAVEPLGRTVGEAFPADLDSFVVTPEGQFVFHPDRDRIMTDVRIGEEGENPELERLVASMTALETGVAAVDRVPFKDGRQWIFYAPVRSAGWSIATMVSERAALAAARRQITWFAAVLAGTLVLMGVSIWIVSGRLADPIARLTGAVREIARGNLDARASDVDRQDEVGELARSFNQMGADLQRIIDERAEEQAENRDAIIFSLAKLAETRDNETGQHLERICTYVRILAEDLARERGDIDEQWVRTITHTAALHDIGKVAVPDAILQKPGKLTDEERVIIQKHTTLGGDTLLAIKQKWGDDDTFLRTATEIAFAHHERWDGTGYPFGLAGDGIALSARIVAVADVYDALTSKRVYKPEMSHEEASRIIIEGSGTQFDPEIVDVFKRMGPELARRAAELHDEPVPVDAGA